MMLKGYAAAMNNASESNTESVLETGPPPSFTYLPTFNTASEDNRSDKEVITTDPLMPSSRGTSHEHA